MQRGTLLYPVHGCSINFTLMQIQINNCPPDAITNPLSIISLISVFVSIKRNTVPHKLCRNYNRYIYIRYYRYSISTHKQKYSHLKVHTEVSIYVLSDCLCALYYTFSFRTINSNIIQKRKRHLALSLFNQKQETTDVFLFQV